MYHVSILGALDALFMDKPCKHHNYSSKQVIKEAEEYVKARNKARKAQDKRLAKLGIL